MSELYLIQPHALASVPTGKLPAVEGGSLEPKTDLDDEDKRNLWPCHEWKMITKWVITITLVKHAERQIQNKSC